MILLVILYPFDLIGFSAGFKQIQTRLVDAGVDVQYAQNRVEQVVVAGGLAGALGQARLVQAALLEEARGEPLDHGDMALGLR